MARPWPLPPRHSDSFREAFFRVHKEERGTRSSSFLRFVLRDLGGPPRRGRERGRDKRRERSIGLSSSSSVFFSFLRRRQRRPSLLCRKKAEKTLCFFLLSHFFLRLHTQCSSRSASPLSAACFSHPTREGGEKKRNNKRKESTSPSLSLCLRESIDCHSFFPSHLSAFPPLTRNG